MRVLFTIFTVAVLFFSATADEKENRAIVADKPILVALNGTVSDEATGELLVGVLIKLEGTDKKTYTDFDGNFFFDEVTQGEHKIVANYISYEKKLKVLKVNAYVDDIKIKLQSSK